MPGVLVEQVDKRSRRRAEQCLHFSVVVFSLEHVSTDTLLVLLPHEIAVVDVRVENDVIALVDFVDHRTEHAKAIHISGRASIKSDPRMILTFLAIVSGDVYVGQSTKGRKIINVRLGMESALIWSDEAVGILVVDGREASVVALYRMLNSIESE